MALSKDLIISVALSVWCLSFQFGYNIAACDSARTGFSKEYGIEVNPDSTDDQGNLIAGKETNWWASNVVAIFGLGALCGSAFVAALVNKFGPKKSMYVVNLFSLASAFVMYRASLTPTWAERCYPGENAEVDPEYVDFCKEHADEITWENKTIRLVRTEDPKSGMIDPLIFLMPLGRFLIGVFVGLSSGISPMYIIEISPKSARGMIGVLNQLLVTVGILIAQLTAFDFVFGDEWLKVFMTPSLLSVLQLALLWYMPESPKYLLMKKDDEAGAKEALKRLRINDSEVEEDFKEMLEEKKASEGVEELGVLDLFKTASIKYQVMSLIAMHIAQQWSGVNAIFFYLNDIITNQLGFTDVSTVNIMRCAVGALNVSMTIVSVKLIESKGRKFLMENGLALGAISMVFVTICLQMSMAKVAFFFICLFIVGFAIGPGPIPWVWSSEFFETNARASSNLVGCIVNWSCGSLLGLMFETLSNMLGYFVFVVFVGVCVVGYLYSKKFISETKGKTGAEIYNDFAPFNKVPLRDLGTEQELEPLKA